MTSTFEREFSFSDILTAVEKLSDVLSMTDLKTIRAEELRNGMEIVEKVQGKRRYFTVWGPPFIKGHEVTVTVSVNGHKLNWRYQTEAPVRIKGEN